MYSTVLILLGGPHFRGYIQYPFYNVLSIDQQHSEKNFTWFQSFCQDKARFVNHKMNSSTNCKEFPNLDQNIEIPT